MPSKAQLHTWCSIGTLLKNYCMKEEEFLVVAVPSLERSIEEFRSDLKDKIQEVKSVLIHVRDITQLVDEDELGDCFIAHLGIENTENNGVDYDSNEYSDVTTWIHERAQVWVSGHGYLPLAPPFGWKLDNFICSAQNPDSSCECLSKYGVAIVNQSSNQQPDDFFIDVNRQLREHIDKLESTVRQHHTHIKLGESAFGFREYTHRGPGRFEILFDPSSSIYQTLRDGLESKWIKTVCQHLNAERSRLRLNISCVYSRPGSTDQDWHTDGDHYGNEPYAVCIFVPLIPLSEETGYTRFWPKSHLYSNLLGLAQCADVCKASINAVDLLPGDFLIYDYTTWHKGVGNKSALERPIVQFLYSCDWYKERKNYGTKSVFDFPSTRNDQ